MYLVSFLTLCNSTRLNVTPICIRKISFTLSSTPTPLSFPHKSVMRMANIPFLFLFLFLLFFGTNWEFNCKKGTKIQPTGANRSTYHLHGSQTLHIYVSSLVYMQHVVGGTFSLTISLKAINGSSPWRIRTYHLVAMGIGVYSVWTLVSSIDRYLNSNIER